MKLAMRLKVDAHSPIPIRRQLAEQIKHVIEGGGVARDEALPSIRELAGYLGINPNTVARVIEDLKRSGYVEARRGKGVFVAAPPPVRPSPALCERFLQDMVLLAESHLETLQRLAQLPSGTRVGVASGPVESAHNLEHSIANAGLPNLTLVGAAPVGAALGRLVRRADVIVCPSSAAKRVHALGANRVQVIVDDRVLDPRAIEMLAAVLVGQDATSPTAAPTLARGRPRSRRSPRRPAPPLGTRQSGTPSCEDQQKEESCR